jgi:hypothetical protein
MISSSEHNEQVGLLSWVHQRYPGLLIFAIPNGGLRTVRTAISLRDEGVVPGVPDLFIPKWKLFVEMKRERGGVVSRSQQRIIEQLRNCGYTVILGKGARDASAQILEFAKTNKYEQDI